MATTPLTGRKQPPSFDGIEDFGYLNSWVDNIPEKVHKCWHSDPEHKREYYTTGKCERMVVCRQCNFLYKVDSSD
jgi:hypothetical protein